MLGERNTLFEHLHRGAMLVLPVQKMQSLEGAYSWFGESTKFSVIPREVSVRTDGNRGK